MDSKTKPSTHVLMMPWDTALNFADRGLRIVTSSGIAPNDQLQWWERKDRITQGAIAGLVRQRWPAQEALEKALADTNTDWTVVRGAEVKGIHTAMEQADQGLELGKGAGRGKGWFRDQKWRGKFPYPTDRSRGLVLLPNNNDKGTWNDQVEHKAQGDNPQKRQRRIGNASSFTPSGKKLFGAFNSAKGCPDERNCPQKALHRCNIITSSDGRVCFATDHGGHQHRLLETSLHTPMGWRRPQDIFPDSPPSTVEAVGLQLQCAKHLAWLGRGDLLQVPWCKRFQGLVVVINLWSGFGGALFALLAAGNRVIAFTSERSDDGTEALLCAFPAAVHLRRVEDIHVEMLQPLLRRRSVSVILVGGKGPCHISTSHQPLQLAHFIQGVTDLPEVREASTQVIGWLESTSSVPDEVKCKYDELLCARHFEIADPILGGSAKITLCG